MHLTMKAKAIISDIFKNMHWGWIVLSVTIMLLNYVLFRGYPRIWMISIGYIPDFWQWITDDVARILRLLVNEICVVMFVRGFFLERSYLRFTAVVMLIELVVLMPLYFFSREVWPVMAPGMIHQLLFNPFIGVLLIIALLYQKYYLSPYEKSGATTPSEE